MIGQHALEGEVKHLHVRGQRRGDAYIDEHVSASIQKWFFYFTT
jgi:hypothetical protein